MLSSRSIKGESWDNISENIKIIRISKDVVREKTHNVTCLKLSLLTIFPLETSQQQNTLHHLCNY